MNKDAKIYIAGHRGLVGSAIWKTLKQQGFTNLIGKTSDELDLTDSLAVCNFFEKEKPEYVFLAAAKVGGIIANNTYRADFIYENLMIQNNVIHQSYKNGVKKLLFLGSTCIYPREAPQPMPENSLLTSPLEYTNEPYAIAKIAGIKMCESYNLQYGTNFISVMPTNLYGPNDNFDLEKSHVLPAMIRKIHLAKCLEQNNWKMIRQDLNRQAVERITGENSKNKIRTILAKYGIFSDKVVLWGTGMPMREFLWSEDMAEACIFIMKHIDFKDTFNKTLNNEIRNTHINIGTGQDISIHDLAKIIQKEIDFSGEISFDSSKPDGTMKKLTDTSKLYQLGWKHHIELSEGIKLMYKFYLKKI
ncbi:GDP-L-fucose synthase family protein [Capnocytophaga catalasegens]|uniref:GDP-L-fucose synthase n=1 Tax=Capnocytophaga catalasegens TaxID=1004260 RepID=A0AAV5AW21_9FLAO|nr:GDP-L-fucose synthase [Capnocytophaga catalasegens]GIZ15188.1 GDP-L-fucose synthase [Capnocytophaga catalasegens]GJM49703.1 GDP-L-fucose synthase [Capnocytophaga catalasegens]GJM52768.1 GDP-L-fucose synthase [Capnocytophaga catalasegens]